MTTGEQNALERIADALEKIVERMPTWQTEYGRQQMPLNPPSRCMACGGPSHVIGVPCPALFATGGRT